MAVGSVCASQGGNGFDWGSARGGLQGSGFRVQGSGSRVQGSGFRVDALDDARGEERADERILLQARLLRDTRF